MSSSAVALCLALLGTPAPSAPAAVALGAPTAGAPALPTRAEALALLCPGATWVQEAHYPKPADLAQATKLCGEKVDTRVVVRHAAWKDGQLVGCAYFDTHRVRALGETLLVAVQPDGRLRRIEVVAFAEPREYLPRATFYAQFQNRALDQELRLERGVRGVAGATLSARAAVQASRRILALHQVLPAPRAVTASK